MRRVGQGTLGAAVGAVLGVIVLGPALLPGYTLHYDLVFVPDLPLSARTLGLDGSVPRAMPNDVLVGVLSAALPGWVVQKVLLLGSLVVAAAGAARLTTTRWGAVAAATAVVWNAWVGQRLGIGHWGYLMGYAMLPWVLGAAARAVQPGPHGVSRRRWWLLAGTLTLAALGGSTAGVLATVLALLTVCLADAGIRQRAAAAGIVLGVSLLVNASWWWPFLTASSRAADPAGVEVFAATADTPFGVLGSALLGGALWNERMWFAERDTVLGAGVALAATLTILVLTVGSRRWWQRDVARGATAAGALGLVVALVASTGPGERLVSLLVESVPGAGLLRDSQKFLALTALLVALACGHLADRLSRARAGVPLLACLVLWPVATLPSLAVGHLGAWGSVSYPRAYLDVAEALDTADGEGSVLVLPWMTYRSYPWDGHRVMLDPWNRLLARDVLSSDDLPVDGRIISGEDPRGQEVSRLLAEEPPPADVLPRLRALGVRYVIVDSTQPDPPGTVVALDAPAVVEAAPLRVYDLGAVEPGRDRHPPVGLLIAGVTALAVAVGVLRNRPRRTARAGDDAPVTS